MNCDIFISGGGISGLSAALIATKLGKKEKYKKANVMIGF